MMCPYLLISINELLISIPFIDINKYGLNVKTAAHISPKILKETVEQISKPLAHVFNMSLQEGIVPVEWKEANIIPLFKKVQETSL